MKAPTIYEDYSTDIELHGKRKRMVRVRLLDDTYLPDKRHKPSAVADHTVVFGAEVELDDHEPIEGWLLFVTTILHDQMAEEVEKHKGRVSEKFSQTKKLKLRESISRSVDPSLSPGAHMKQMKQDGARYFLIESLTGDMLHACIGID